MSYVKQPLPILLLLTLIGGYTSLVLSGSVSFTPWGQVSYVHEHGGLSLSDAYSHPHAIRYLLVYPVYALQASLEGVSLELLFSFYLECALIFAAGLIAYAVTLHVEQAKSTFFVVMSGCLSRTVYFIFFDEWPIINRVSCGCMFGGVLYFSYAANQANIELCDPSRGSGVGECNQRCFSVYQ